MNRLEQLRKLFSFRQVNGLKFANPRCQGLGGQWTHIFEINSYYILCVSYKKFLFLSEIQN